jgi:hypothetical protein
MLVFNKIIPLYFFIGFAIGILYVYLNQPRTKIIIKHPTPDNAGKIVYMDKSENCYKYLAEEIKCPSSGAVNHPLIID